MFSKIFLVYLSQLPCIQYRTFLLLVNILLPINLIKTKLVMNFEKYFKANKIPEWRKLYIDMQMLDDMLLPFFQLVKYKAFNSFHVQQYYTAVQYLQRKSKLQLILEENLEETLEKHQIKFVNFFSDELTKVNDFYELQIQKFKLLLKCLSLNLELLQKDRQNNFQQYCKNYPILKQDFYNLYEDIIYLQRFCCMNRQASKIILARFQEGCIYLEKTVIYQFRIAEVMSQLQAFQEEDNLQILKEDVQNFYISTFHPQTASMGIKQLKQKGKRKIFNKKDISIFGASSGLLFGLFITQIVLFIDITWSGNPYYGLFFPMFRGIGLFLMYYWFLAGNVWGWQNSHINYRRIFKFNYHYSSPPQILKRCSIFTVLYLIVFIGSMYKISYDYLYSQGEISKNSDVNFIIFNPAFGPLILWIIFIVYMVIPTQKAFNGQGRRFFFKILLNSIIAPFYFVEFRYHWVIGQFMSFVGPIKDLDYTICFYYSYIIDHNHQPYSCGNSRRIEMGLIAACLPAMWKTMLYLRQGYQDGKINYECFSGVFRFTTIFLTSVFSYLSLFHHVFFYIWIAFALISAFINCYWDIKLDWGFFAAETNYPYLRKELAYDNPAFYYTCIIIDLPLRFTWALSVSPNIASIFHVWPQFFTMIISSLELFRSNWFLWNFIRIEREQLDSEGEFKAIPEIIFPYDVSQNTESILNQEQTDAKEQNIQDIINSTQKHEKNYRDTYNAFKSGFDQRNSQMTQQKKILEQELKGIKKQVSSAIEKEYKNQEQFKKSQNITQ